MPERDPDARPTVGATVRRDAPGAAALAPDGRPALAEPREAAVHADGGASLLAPREQRVRGNGHADAAAPSGPGPTAPPTTDGRTAVAAPPRPALVLVGHGSRDADGVQECWALVEEIRRRAPDLQIEAGFIELAEPSADVAIDRLVAGGATDVVSVPLVLLAAGHLKNDGPATLARARQRHPHVRFRMGRDLGIDPLVLSVCEERTSGALAALGASGVTPRPEANASGDDVASRSEDGSAPGASTSDPVAMSRPCTDADPTDDLGVVLVGRGSSDPDATSDMWKLARLLSDRRGLPVVEPAFVSVARPRVAEALERCRRLGARRIAVVPFFLFTGLLVPKIYEQAHAWAADHEDVEVIGGPHLGAHPKLARLALERYREAIDGDVRMSCDLCVYRVTLPGYEEKVGMPISLTPHGDEKPKGRRRNRRTVRTPQPKLELKLVDEARQRRRGRFRTGAADPGADGPPAVDVRGLTFAYPDGSEALADVTVSIAPGERVALLGPNGAGKTTLVLHLNGVLEVQEGSVAVGGTTLTSRTARELRRKVGVCFQDPDDQLFLPTVRRDVAFGPANLGLTGTALTERTDRALALFGLEELADQPPHRLSLGQRRRAALAGVVAMEPDVLVLDEPSSNLDPAARRELADEIARLPQTSILVTHDLPYALELCPRAIVMDQGQVVADGPTREILADEGFMRAHRLELPAGFDPLAG